MAVVLAACSGGGDVANSSTTQVPPASVSTAAPISQEAPTTTTRVEATTTTLFTEPASPFDTVVDWYAALNGEDIDAMADLWPGGDQELFELLTKGLHLKVSTTCSPGEEGEGSVRCQEDTGRNDFLTPAGLPGSSTMLFIVEKGAISSVEQIDKAPSHYQYEEAFGEWLQEIHPEVYDSSYSGGDWYPFATADQALDVLALIDDFLAQSDEYPVEG